MSSDFPPPGGGKGRYSRAKMSRYASSGLKAEAVKQDGKYMRERKRRKSGVGKGNEPATVGATVRFVCALPVSLFPHLVSIKREFERCQKPSLATKFHLRSKASR